MEIPIVFETSKVSISSHAVNRQNEGSRPFGEPVVKETSHVGKIPIQIESRMEKKMGVGGAGDLLSAEAFRDTSPKKSKAYFEIPINFPDEKRGGSARENSKQTSPRRKHPEGTIFRDDEKTPWTHAKPQERTEIVLQVLPSKKMSITKAANFEVDLQDVSREVEDLGIGSSGKNDIHSGSVSKPGQIQDSSDDPEASGVAYTREEVGVMREEISKLEKIAELMKNAAVVWSQTNDLSGDATHDQQNLKRAEELLTQDLLELDKVEVEGNELIRAERKKAINAIESLLKDLENKMKAT